MLGSSLPRGAWRVLSPSLHRPNAPAACPPACTLATLVIGDGVTGHEDVCCVPVAAPPQCLGSMPTSLHMIAFHDVLVGQREQAVSPAQLITRESFKDHPQILSTANFLRPLFMLKGSFVLEVSGKRRTHCCTALTLRQHIRQPAHDCTC